MMYFFSCTIYLYSKKIYNTSWALKLIQNFLQEIKKKKNVINKYNPKNYFKKLIRPFILFIYFLGFTLDCFAAEVNSDDGFMNDL